MRLQKSSSATQISILKCLHVLLETKRSCKISKVGKKLLILHDLFIHYISYFNVYHKLILSAQFILNELKLWTWGYGSSGSHPFFCCDDPIHRFIFHLIIKSMGVIHLHVVSSSIPHLFCPTEGDTSFQLNWPKILTIARLSKLIGVDDGDY